MWKLLHKWQIIADEKQLKAAISLAFFWHVEAWSSHACQGAHYLSGSHLVAIGVHGGQDVDARVMDKRHDPMVSSSILLTEKLGELDEQLTAEHFIAMHVAHVLELWLHWGGSGEVRGRREVKKPQSTAKRDI